MMAIWGETSKEEEDSQEEEVVEALIARSEFELDLESVKLVPTQGYGTWS